MRRKSKLHNRLTIILIAFLFSLLAGRYSRDFSKGHIETTLCTSVVDGDTIRVNFKGQKERVRILDIDAPEVHRTAKLRGQALKAGVSEDVMLERGKEATKALETMVLGKEIQLAFHGASGEICRDGFGRLLCHVSVNGTNVGVNLRERGLVEGYRN